MNDKQMLQQTEQENTLEAKAPVFWSTPAVDIYETEDDLVLISDLPGVAEDGLTLEVEHQLLSLEALIEDGSEQRKGFARRFKLGDKIDAAASQAQLKDGILTLRLPKLAEAKPKRIAVKTLH